MPKTNRDPDRSTATVVVANGDNGPNFTKEPRYTFAYSADGKFVRITESNGKKHVYTIIPKPENPGKCVLEVVMHMPKDDPRHQMYLNIFDSMRSNARQVLGKDGLDVLWNNVPIEVRADILNMTTEEHPILKRFEGGWAGTEIFIRILRNVRDQAKRNQGKEKTKPKSNRKAMKQVVTAGETGNPAPSNEPSSSKSNLNTADEDDSEPTPERIAPSKGVNSVSGKKSTPNQPADDDDDDDEGWLANPVVSEAPKKPKRTTKPSTRTGRQGAPTNATVTQIDEQHMDEDQEEEGEDEQPSLAQSTLTKPTRGKSVIKSTPNKQKRKAPVADDEHEYEAPASAQQAPLKSKGKLVAAGPSSTRASIETDKSPAAPSGQQLKRKRAEPDEDDFERASSTPRDISPVAPTTRDTSPELPLIVRNTSPAPTEIISSPSPVQKAGNKKRKAEELTREESGSWEANVEEEIAKLDANSRNAKKDKRASNKPAAPKDKTSSKPPRGKKGARHETPVDDAQVEETVQRKRPPPRQRREAGAADSEDLFVVNRKAKEELVDTFDAGGSNRKTRNRGKK
ncbi:unnamed protein product [Rhizoctonia solani]|uniref:Uncharacterized protein n=2 Tax=Rhizoctonia solani TaxID=456999 RepID=A0A8H2WL47_9AGAM